MATITQTPPHNGIAAPEKSANFSQLNPAKNSEKVTKVALLALRILGGLALGVTVGFLGVALLIAWHDTLLCLASIPLAILTLDTLCVKIFSPLLNKNVLTAARVSFVAFSLFFGGAAVIGLLMSSNLGNIPIG
jgi:hypothetical protein